MSARAVHRTGVAQNKTACQKPLMRGLFLALLPAASLMLSGCLVKTAADVVTAPVKIASKGVDLATTSQSEADEKRGRELRKREERLGELEREYWKLDEKCEDGNRRACDEQRAVYDEIQSVRATLPAREPEN